jgi:hypothetical protein
MLFLTALRMQTIALLIMTIIGGLLSLFGAAGWSSFKEKKLPDTPVLFRWFISGLLVSGLGGYAWIYGAGGDPSALLDKVGGALEMKEVMETLTSAAGTSATVASTVVPELNVGMPAF